jgi:hypothetical protein
MRSFNDWDANFSSHSLTQPANDFFGTKHDFSLTESRYPFMGLLNNCNNLPLDPHVDNREPYKKNKRVFKKHALSLAEGVRPALS